MQINNDFTRLLEVDFPVIMAPMFLVSNEAMMVKGIQRGILAAFPSLNYRKEGELDSLLVSLNSEKERCSGSYGVNLIVQKTNPLYKKHLDICVEHKVPVYITSLGNPKEVIDRAHAYGAKVLCDVTNMTHAKKAFSLGCDGFIAVGQGAGGHAGPYPLHLLVPSLKRAFPDKLIVAAGGISTGSSVASMLCLGADGVSVGTRFIACEEAGVKNEYKEAIVSSRMDDIVLSTRLSGTPCNVINTEEARRMGYKQNAIERFLSNNPRTKKWFKTLVHLRGLKRLEKSVLPANYNNLWSAGQSVELIDEILSCEKIIDKLKEETFSSLQHTRDFLSP